MERYYPSLAAAARLALAAVLAAPLLRIAYEPITVVEGSLVSGAVSPLSSSLHYLWLPWRPGPLAAVRILYTLGLLGALAGLALLALGTLRRRPGLVEASGYLVVLASSVALAAAKSIPYILAPLQGNYSFQSSLGTIDLGEVVVSPGPGAGLLALYQRIWLPLALLLAILSVEAGETGGEGPRGSSV